MEENYQLKQTFRVSSLLIPPKVYLALLRCAGVKKRLMRGWKRLRDSWGSISSSRVGSSKAPLGAHNHPSNRAATTHAWGEREGDGKTQVRW